jgi:hypothetical protein
MGNKCEKTYNEKCSIEKDCLEYTSCIVYDGPNLECSNDEEFVAPSGTKLNLMLSMIWAKICSIIGNITTINTTITEIQESILEINTNMYTFINYRTNESYPIGPVESSIIGLNHVINEDGIYRFQYSGDLDMKLGIDYTIKIMKNGVLANNYSLSEPKTNLTDEDDTKYISNRISIFATNVTCVVGDIISVDVYNSIGNSNLRNNQFEIVKIG